MKDPEDARQKIRALQMRIAELDLIIDSIDGEHFTYLNIVRSHADLSNRENAIKEQNKVYEQLQELTGKYFDILREKSAEGSHLSEKSKGIIDEIKRKQNLTKNGL